LEDTIKDFSPVLVVLDPLYMMLGKAEENSATEVRDILRWLTYIRNTYGCAIIICHHYNKQKDGKAKRGGTQIRGTSEFHAWVESALYIKTTTEQNTVEIEREFRAFPSMPQFTVKMELGEPGELYYRPMVKAAKFSVEMEVKKEDVLSWIASTPRTFEELKSITRYSRRELLRVLTELVDEGYVLKDEGIGRGKKTTYVMANLEVD
jgi:RecA-family ATPase